MLNTDTNRWNKRDVLTFIIFNLLIIGVTMIAKMAEDMVLSPQNTFYVGSWLFPLVSTPFYMVMADRIGKPGVLAGSILLFGVMYVMMGGLYCAIVAIVGAVLGELIMWGKGSYHDVKRVIAGFFMYWVTFGFYGVIPYLFYREAYMEQLSTFYDAADVAAMTAQYTEPLSILLMVAMFAIGTVAGGFIGSKLLKKHVRKAKIA